MLVQKVCWIKHDMYRKIEMCQPKYPYAGQESEYVGLRIYHWGGPIPAVWFKPPGKGGLRRLADVLNPPQNVSQGQLMC
jgi:hypothetical protein